MSANYWASTQYTFWQFTKESLAAQRQKLEDENADLIKRYPLPGQRELSMYFNSQINRLAKRLGIRQQAIATAQIYIKRFYTRVEIHLTNPYLIIVTALYLACKAEECPHHIRLVLSESRALWPDMVTLDTSRIGECEFFLISEMSSQLIVHQPYRTLSALQSELGLGKEDMNHAWTVIGDHYMTDLPLLCPPHIVALSAILLALAPGAMGGNNGSGGGGAAGGASIGAGANSGGSGASQTHAQSMPVSLPQVQQTRGAKAALDQAEKAKDRERTQEAGSARAEKFSAWLAESSVDIEAIVECTQEMISFYECQEHHNNKRTQEQVNRFIKARGLDK